MELKVGTPESNYQEKALCILLLDDSGSMHGEPIRQLNKALKEFYEDIQNDARLSTGLEIGIVKFGEGTEVLQEPALSMDITIPTLQADDPETKLNEGVRVAIRMAEERKSEFKRTNQSYKRPWIIMLTDGAPTDGDVSALAQEIQEDTKNGKYIFLPIGVDGADTQTLKKISGYVKNSDGSMKQMDVMSMESAKFSDFFEWLSSTMSEVYNSQEGEDVSLPAPTWMKGFVA